MAKNYIQEGDVLDYTAGADITSGQMVLIGTKVGVAVTNIANGSQGAMAMEGVFSYAKLSTDAPAQGAALYWDNTNKRLTVSASGNTYAGYAAAAAANGDATVSININH